MAPKDLSVQPCRSWKQSWVRLGCPDFEVVMCHCVFAKLQKCSSVNSINVENGRNEWVSFGLAVISRELAGIEERTTTTVKPVGLCPLQKG